MRITRPWRGTGLAPWFVRDRLRRTAEYLARCGVRQSLVVHRSRSGQHQPATDSIEPSPAGPCRVYGRVGPCGDRRRSAAVSIGSAVRDLEGTSVSCSAPVAITIEGARCSCSLRYAVHGRRPSWPSQSTPQATAASAPAFTVVPAPDPTRRSPGPLTSSSPPSPQRRPPTRSRPAESDRALGRQDRRRPLSCPLAGSSTAHAVAYGAACWSRRIAPATAGGRLQHQHLHRPGPDPHRALERDQLVDCAQPDPAAAAPAPTSFGPSPRSARPTSGPRETTSARRQHPTAVRELQRHELTAVPPPPNSGGVMLGLTAIASNNVRAVGAISSQTFTSAHWNAHWSTSHTS